MLIRLVVYPVAIFILLFVFVRLMETHLVFFPMRPVTSMPPDIGLEVFEKVVFLAQDGIRLSGWFVPNAGARFTVLFFHGNAGNIGHRLEKLKILHELGLSVLLFDYRGYGDSGGKPSERGILKDTDAALRYLTDERGLKPGSVVLYGESLGGVFAADLAARCDCAGLITEGTFTSIPEMARTAFPFVPRFFLSMRLDALSKMPHIRIPKLIIHSIGDEIVPYAMGEKLYEAAGAPKTLLKLNGGHNTGFVEFEGLYREGLTEFLSALRAG